MGVDINITLPSCTRVGDVAKVIGALVGKEKRMVPLSHSDNSYCTVDGVECKSSPGCPEMCQITFHRKGETRYASYFFEWSKTPGARGIITRSGPLWIAIGKRLVDFFGGTLDYNDCDDIDADYFRAWKEPRLIAAEDGDEWQGLQNRLYAVEPLTQTEIKDAKKYAAYPERD